MFKTIIIKHIANILGVRLNEPFIIVDRNDDTVIDDYDIYLWHRVDKNLGLVYVDDDHIVKKSNLLFKLLTKQCKVYHLY